MTPNCMKPCSQEGTVWTGVLFPFRRTCDFLYLHNGIYMPMTGVCEYVYSKLMCDIWHLTFLGIYSSILENHQLFDRIQVLLVCKTCYNPSTLNTGYWQRTYLLTQCFPFSSSLTAMSCPCCVQTLSQLNPTAGFGRFNIILSGFNTNYFQNFLGLPRFGFGKFDKFLSPG